MQFVSLPLSIKLNQCSLTLSYRLSSHGSAFDLLRRCGLPGLPEAAVAVILSRALLGLDRLHSVGVLHRNLCAKHLLLTDFQPNVLLCGLGSICQFPPRGFDVGRNDLPPVYTSWRGWNVQSSADAYSHPLAWYAPEVVVQDFTGYSWPADIYSFGLVMAELYTGQPPYVDLKPTEIMVEKLCEQAPPDLKQTGLTSPPPSKAMLQVYNACTQYNAKNRPTTKSLLQTPWIQWGLGLKPDYDHLENYSELSPPTA
ncbi:serine/threonine-protein kinase OSR1 [Clonorchis sinensis]|uniref:Serine/threonine-protein kinase OSR1 n=1 Tax=Clonorchis sinensis TaxID=79923 RepID=G7Y9J6_CLOSI|nr:serine/threonine-protein kinase OSR1 [Clonorchis sinensis]